jgi:[NiFe] hydrogenase diaphorase moiety large subunit
MKASVQKVLDRYKGDPTRLMDILIDTQSEVGYVPDEAVAQIAGSLGISRVDVEQTLSFYHFFNRKPAGEFQVYLNNSVVAGLYGRRKIAEAFEEAAGCKFGQVSDDGLIGLYDTSCIGMNDQEPAALINNVLFTRLTPFRVREIIRDIKTGKKVEDLVVEGLGDGENAGRLVRSMVQNNIRKIGPVLDPNYAPGEALKKIAGMTPEQVIQEIKLSNIRGRGGAGFPTGMKWEFCRKAQGTQKHILCNADEGEPGTFKDRVILTELPRLLFEGMAVAGYAVGATEGILYVRYEYKYLQRHLENVLAETRKKKLLGKRILGKEGFDFDIRIQFGAGAYVCGEESALIESAEGKRGEPRARPPFPVESGYLGCPTVVNNVETLCSAVKIILNGGEWYKSFGTMDSTGTKVLSVSGDCKYPGIYEVEWGFSVNDILDMVGADEPQAVQVGGPSGTLISPDEFERILCYSDLSTGGSLIIIGKQRDLLRDVVMNFTDFFVEESCGSCVPCRCLTVLIRQKLKKILDGHGVKQDIEDMAAWGPLMKFNRCGLGQTAVNPVLSSLRNFRHLYEDKIQKDRSFDCGFDLQAAVAESCWAVHRKPLTEENNHE